MFDHLSRLEPDEASWLDLPEVAPKARVLLKQASDRNRPYFNALLKRANRNRARPDAVDAQRIDQGRQEDRELFGLHVLVGWEGIEDQDGEPLAFNRDLGREFCQKLPGWIFDKLRVHAATPERYLRPGEELPPDPEELAGNSVSGSAGS